MSADRFRSVLNLKSICSIWINKKWTFLFHILHVLVTRNSTPTNNKLYYCIHSFWQLSSPYIMAWIKNPLHFPSLVLSCYTNKINRTSIKIKVITRNMCLFRLYIFFHKVCVDSFISVIPATCFHWQLNRKWKNGRNLFFFLS